MSCSTLARSNFCFAHHKCKPSLTWNLPRTDVSTLNDCAVWPHIYLISLYRQIKKTCLLTCWRFWVSVICYWLKIFLLYCCHVIFILIICSFDLSDPSTQSLDIKGWVRVYVYSIIVLKQTPVFGLRASVFVTEKLGAMRMDHLLFCARPKAAHYQHRGR